MPHDVRSQFPTSVAIVRRKGEWRHWVLHNFESQPVFRRIPVHPGPGSIHSMLKILKRPQPVRPGLFDNIGIDDGPLCECLPPLLTNNVEGGFHRYSSLSTLFY